MVFKTFDGDSFGEKIGFSKRPFAQWSSDISKATADIDGFFAKAKVGFKTAFTVPKGENGGLLNLLQSNELDAAFSDFNKQTKNGTDGVARFMEECTDKSFKKYIESVDDGKYTVQGYTKFVNESNTALKATSLSSRAAAVGMKALSIAGNMLVGIGIGLAINLIVTGISKLVNAQKDAIEKANELASSWKEQRNALESNKKTIDSITADYAKLSQGVDKFGNITTLTAEQTEKYNDILSQIDTMFPDLIKWHTDASGAMVAEKISVKELTQAYKDQQQAYNDSVVMNAKDSWKGYKAGIGENWFSKHSDKSLLDQEKLFKYIVDNISNAEKLKVALGNAQNAEGYNEQSAIRDSFKDFGLDWANTGTPNQILEKNAQQLMDNASKFEAKYRSLIAELNAETSKVKPILNVMLDSDYSFQSLDTDVQNAVKSIASNFDFKFFSEFEDENDMYAWITDNFITPLSDPSASAEMQKAITTLLDPKNIELPADQYKKIIEDSISKLPQDLQEQIKIYLKFDFVTEDMAKQLKEKVGDINTSSLTVDDIKIVLNPDFNFTGNSLNDLKAQIEAVANKIPALTSTLQPLNISLTDIADKTSILATAWKEMDEAGEVSIATITKLIETDANWADSISIVNGKITINKDTIVGSAKSIILAKKQEALAVIESCEKQIEMLQLSAKASRESAQEFIKSASATALAAGMAGASGKMYFDEMNARANGNVAGVSNFDKEITTARKSVEIFDTMLSQLEGDDPFRTTTDSAKDAKDAINDLKQAMSSAQSAINSLLSMTMDMIKQGYADEKDEIEKLKDAEKDRYDTSKKALEDAYEQEKKTHDLQKQAIEDAKDGAKKVLDLKLKALQAEKDAYYWEKELANQNKSVADLQSEYDIVVQDDSLDGQAKAKDIAKQLAAEKEKLADMQFDHGIKKQEDALNNEYSNIEEMHNNKIALLEQESNLKEEQHQADLERLENEYNAFIKQQDDKIRVIDDYTKLESNIRAEAIKMIEDKNSGLYQKLLDWNQKYGETTVSPCTVMCIETLHIYAGKI